jgi:hypothetical protein
VGEATQTAGTDMADDGTVHSSGLLYMVDTNTVHVQLSENQGSKIKGVGGNMVDYVIINGKMIASSNTMQSYSTKNKTMRDSL